MEKCSRSLAGKIYENVRILNAGNLPVEIKDIPDSDRAGVMDSREYAVRKAIFELRRLQPSGAPDIAAIRKSTATYTLDLTESPVAEESFPLECEGVAVTVFTLGVDKNAPLKPAAVYLHGGSFFAGQARSYRNICAFVAEKAGCAVFNLEYSLAPEHPYPCAVNECLALLKHLHENAARYNIDASRICVFGDSAGGNIALCAALAADAALRPALLGLFYPCTDLCAEDGLYAWEESAYDIAPEQRELIVSRLGLGRTDGSGSKALMELLARCYLGSVELDVRRAPAVSPVYADLSALPECILFTAEFDSLRPQEEYFASRLLAAGGRCRVLRYRGVSHAFLDYFGFLPQAEASLLELSSLIRKS